MMLKPPNMIFSEILKQGHLINDQSFVSDPELDNLSHADGSLWCSSPEEQNCLSDLKESVLVGYNWGLVRGLTSALTFLPDGLREKLIETQEERQKIQSLYKAVHSLSTLEAMEVFHDGIMTKRSVEQSESTDASSEVAGLQDQSTNLLQNYFEELKSLTIKSRAIEVNLVVDHWVDFLTVKGDNEASR